MALHVVGAAFVGFGGRAFVGCEVDQQHLAREGPALALAASGGGQQAALGRQQQDEHESDSDNRRHRPGDVGVQYAGKPVAADG